MNQALLGETKHQLILGACVSNWSNQQRMSVCVMVKSTTNECLCYHELNKRVRLFQNKKVVRLFTPNSANFGYQINQQRRYHKLIFNT